MLKDAKTEKAKRTIRDAILNQMELRASIADALGEPIAGD